MDSLWTYVAGRLGRCSPTRDARSPEQSGASSSAVTPALPSLEPHPAAGQRVRAVQRVRPRRSAGSARGVTDVPGDGRNMRSIEHARPVRASFGSIKGGGPSGGARRGPRGPSASGEDLSRALVDAHNVSVRKRIVSVRSLRVRGLPEGQGPTRQGGNTGSDPVMAAVGTVTSSRGQSLTSDPEAE